MTGCGLLVSQSAGAHNDSILELDVVEGRLPPRCGMDGYSSLAKSSAASIYKGRFMLMAWISATRDLTVALTSSMTRNTAACLPE